MYDEIDFFYVDDITVAFSRMILNRVFMNLENSFTTEDFSRSYVKVFKTRRKKEEALQALVDSIEGELVSEVDKDKYTYNGVLMDSPDLN